MSAFWTPLFPWSLQSFPSKDPEAFEKDYANSIAKEPAPTATAPRKQQKAEAEDDDDFMTVTKGGKTLQLTVEAIFKNLQAVQEARGKKVIYSSLLSLFALL